MCFCPGSAGTGPARDLLWLGDSQECGCVPPPPCLDMDTATVFIAPEQRHTHCFSNPAKELVIPADKATGC